MATTDSWFIGAADGNNIMIISRVKRTYETPEPGVSITREIAKPHADADAAMFFAAPKLLAAAKALVEYCDLTRDLQGEYIDALRAAIAEAETVIDGAEEAKAELARCKAEINALCGSGPEMPVVP